MSSFKKKGLGRGLTALFGDQKSEIKQKEKINHSGLKASIGDLSPNKYQPRAYFNEEKLTELANSIKKNGIIQPIAVREDKVDPGRYEIVAGERRWLAAQKAGLHEVPIILLDLDDNEALEVAIIETIQRDVLNVIEEAKGYQRLSDEFSYDHEKIAKFMSKSRSHISNTMRLLTLPKDVIGMIEEGNLTAGQARPLIGLPSATNIAEEIVAKKLGMELDELCEITPGRVGEDSQYWLNSDKIKKDIGWSEQVTLDKGIEYLILWGKKYKKDLLEQETFFQLRA